MLSFVATMKMNEIWNFLLRQLHSSEFSVITNTDTGNMIHGKCIYEKQDSLLLFGLNYNDKRRTGNR